MTMILVKIKNSFSEMEERKKGSYSDSIDQSNEDLKNLCLLLNEENNNKDEDSFEDILSRVESKIKKEYLNETDNVRDFSNEEK